MKSIKNKSLILLLILIVVTLFILVIINFNHKSTTTLTQLSSQGKKQMMGYIIKTNKGKLVLIDGGTEKDTENLIKNIKKNGEKVDYWFITHAHDDHAEAFIKIVEKTNIPIDNIYISLNDYTWYEQYEPNRKDFTKKLINTLKNDKLANKVKEPKTNEKIQIDNLCVEVLGIKNPEITDNPGNEQSMILKINTKKNSLLILGDIGKKGSKKLIDTQKDKLKSDIVQMSHHGQRGATEELYKIINPKICLWPTPEWIWNSGSENRNNSEILETLEVRKWMENLQVKEKYIAKDGDITIKIE